MDSGISREDIVDKDRSYITESTNMQSLDLNLPSNHSTRVLVLE